MRPLALTSPGGALTATVSAAGGILTSLRREKGAMALLYRAPWLNEPPAADEAAPLIRRLAGEWVGVPFGCVTHDDGLFLHRAPHGLPVNGEWRITAATSREVVMHYDYPPAYPLRQLERHIALTDDGVDFSLTVSARRACRFPVGLHPIFPVGGDAGEVEIVANGEGMVYPQPVEPGVSRLRPAARFTRLQAVPARDSSLQDLTRLPLPEATEEIVQLLDPRGRVTLRYPQRRLQLTLSWRAEQLPHCLLWISNGGRRSSPWNGRNYCLGVEPVCSAWDLGPASLTANPLSQAGAPTAVGLDADETLSLTYHLRLTEMD